MIPLRSPLRSKDVAEIVVGSMMLAAPLAVTEEVWSLGGELSSGRIAIIALTSFLVIGVFGSYRCPMKPY